MGTGYNLNPYKVEMPTFKHLLVLSCLVLLTIAVNAQNNVQYTVINRCPNAINLYIGGILQSNLASKGSTTLSLGPIAGFFFTDANNGTAATGSATRAGFFGDANVSRCNITCVCSLLDRNSDQVLLHRTRSD